MKTFTFRLTFRFAALVTATTATVLLVGGFLLAHQAKRGLEALHDIEVHELVELIGTDPTLGPAAIAERIEHDTDSDAALFATQVADARGQVLFRSGNLGEMVMPQPPDGVRHWTVNVPTMGRVYVSNYAMGPWRIFIGSPLAPSERSVHDYLQMCVPLLLGVAVIGVGLGYTFSRATLRPLRAIEATAHRIRADNLNERIPVPPGRDEIVSLTVLLNQMFDRLQNSFDQIGRFTADVSHELKTPLALIRLNAEKMRPRLAADAEAGAALADILEEVNRLHQVIDRLLFLAKTESGALKLPMRSVEIAGLVAPLAEDAAALAEDRGVRFELVQTATGTIEGEPDLLRQLLLNLVSNAVNASPPQGLVRLESTATEERWLFTVTDEGPGIPAEELPRLFQRFTRFAATTATETRGGHGLGLAICKSIVDLHHGTIGAENRQDRSGLRAVVELPRYRHAPPPRP